MDLVTLVLACSVYPNNSVVNAMVEINSQNNPYMISGQLYKTESQALAKANALKDSGASFEIGLMQIPDFWLSQNPTNLDDLLRPCKNMVLATQILNKLVDECNGSESCALSMYKTNDKAAGIDYATQVLNYADTHPFKAPPPLD